MKGNIKEMRIKNWNGSTRDREKYRYVVKKIQVINLEDVFHASNCFTSFYFFWYDTFRYGLPTRNSDHTYFICRFFNLSCYCHLCSSFQYYIKYYHYSFLDISGFFALLLLYVSFSFRFHFYSYFCLFLSRKLLFFTFLLAILISSFFNIVSLFSSFTSPPQANQYRLLPHLIFVRPLIYLLTLLYIQQLISELLDIRFSILYLPRIFLFFFSKILLLSQLASVICRVSIFP